MASLYPSNETIQTAKSKGLSMSHIGNSILKPLVHPIKLNLVLYVPKLTQFIVSTYNMFRQ